MIAAPASLSYIAAIIPLRMPIGRPDRQRTT